MRPPDRALLARSPDVPARIYIPVPARRPQGDGGHGCRVARLHARPFLAAARGGPPPLPAGRGGQGGLARRRGGGAQAPREAVAN